MIPWWCPRGFSNKSNNSSYKDAPRVFQFRQKLRHTKYTHLHIPNDL